MPEKFNIGDVAILCNGTSEAGRIYEGMEVTVIGGLTERKLNDGVTRVCYMVDLKGPKNQHMCPLVNQLRRKDESDDQEDGTQEGSWDTLKGIWQPTVIKEKATA